MMQATGGFHAQIIKAFAHISINISDNAKDFDATDTVPNAHTLFGNSFVLLFLFRSQFLASWYFHGLIGDYIPLLIIDQRPSQTMKGLGY